MTGKFYVYGDSLLKATVPDEQFRYHFHADELLDSYPAGQQVVQPVLMTLPPIDAARYLDFICRGGADKGRILRWLGDCQMIYRYQELYSDTVAQVAAEQAVPLIPVRRAFLWDQNYCRMISADGIHLNMTGYRRLFDTIADWTAAHLA